MTADDYYQQLKALMPKGIAWVDDDPVLRSVAQECATLHWRTDRLFIESIPTQTEQNLTEWEKDWGLPDLCFTDTSISGRRANLVAKVRNNSVPNRAFFLAVLKDLGYPYAALEHPQCLRAGFRAGERVYSEDWHYVVIVKTNAQQVQIKPMRAGFRAGERLYQWGDDVLTCYLKKLFQAHIKVLVAYE